MIHMQTCCLQEPGFVCMLKVEAQIQKEQKVGGGLTQQVSQSLLDLSRYFCEELG